MKIMTPGIWNGVGPLHTERLNKKFQKISFTESVKIEYNMPKHSVEGQKILFCKDFLKQPPEVFK